MAAVDAATADLAVLASGTVAAPAASVPATDAGTTPAPTTPAAAQPADTQPATTEEALTQLAAGTSSFTAVPVVESDLVTFSATTPGLTGISPAGGTVGDAVYAVPLTASWITPTMKDAAAVFLAYLRGPGGDQAFTENGFVLPGATPAGSTGPDASTSPAPVRDSRRPQHYRTRVSRSPMRWPPPSA